MTDAAQVNSSSKVKNESKSQLKQDQINSNGLFKPWIPNNIVN